MNYKIFAILLLVALCCLTGITPVEAQCAMCKAAAESNMRSGGSDPSGLNAGILYMFLMPYMIVAAIGIWWYRNRRKEAAAMDIPYTEDELAKLN